MTLYVCSSVRQETDEQVCGICDLLLDGCPCHELRRVLYSTRHSNLQPSTLQSDALDQSISPRQTVFQSHIHIFPI